MKTKLNYSMLITSFLVQCYMTVSRCWAISHNLRLQLKEIKISRQPAVFNTPSAEA